MTGKYYWARLGFLPDRGSWEFKLRDALKAKLMTVAGHLGQRRIQQIVRILESERPEAIRLIAALPDLVPSTTERTADGRPKRIKLGVALLAEGGISWYGELNFSDEASMEVFKKEVRGGR